MSWYTQYFCYIYLNVVLIYEVLYSIYLKVVLIYIVLCCIYLNIFLIYVVPCKIHLNDYFSKRKQNKRTDMSKKLRIRQLNRFNNNLIVVLLVLLMMVTPMTSNKCRPPVCIAVNKASVMCSNAGSCQNPPPPPYAHTHIDFKWRSSHSPKLKLKHR